MKLFAASIATETNAFPAVPTGLENFQIQRGLTSCSSVDLSKIWGALACARGDEFVQSLTAWAEPSGNTTRPAYESLRDELLSDLSKAMPVDAPYLPTPRIGLSAAGGRRFDRSTEMPQKRGEMLLC